MNRMSVRIVEKPTDSADMPAWMLSREGSGIDDPTFKVNWYLRQRLSNPQWAKVLAALPGRISARARNGGDTRRFLEAVLWRAHTQAYWSDIPPEYGSWHAIYIRFGRWVHGDVWQGVVKAMNELPETQAMLGAMVGKYLVNYQARHLRNWMAYDA